MYITKAIINIIDNINHNVKINILFIKKGRLNKFINPIEITNDTVSIINIKKSIKIFFIFNK